MARITNLGAKKRDRELLREYDELWEKRENTDSPSFKEKLQKLIDKNRDMCDELDEQVAWENYTYDLVETMLCGTGVTCRGHEKELVEIARNIVKELRYGHE